MEYRKTQRREVKSSNASAKYQMADPKKRDDVFTHFMKFRNVPVITAKLNILLTFFKSQVAYLSSAEGLKFYNKEIQDISKACLDKDIPVLSKNVNLLREYCKTAYDEFPRSGTVKAFMVNEYDKTGKNGEVLRDEKGKIQRYLYIGFFSNIRRVPDEVLEENDLTLERSHAHQMLHQIHARFFHVRSRLFKFQSNIYDTEVLGFVDETIRHLESMQKNFEPFEAYFANLATDAPEVKPETPVETQAKPHAVTFTNSEIVDSVSYSNKVSGVKSEENVRDDNVEEEEEPPRPKRRQQKTYRPKKVQPKNWDDEKRRNNVVVETSCNDTVVVVDDAVDDNREDIDNEETVPSIEGVTIPAEDMQPLSLNEKRKTPEAVVSLENKPSEDRFDILIPVYNCTNEVFLHSFKMTASEYQKFMLEFSKFQSSKLRFNNAEFQ